MKLSIGDEVTIKKCSNGEELKVVITEFCPCWKNPCPDGFDLPCFKCGEKFISTYDMFHYIWIDDPNEIPWCEYWS